MTKLGQLGKLLNFPTLRRLWLYLCTPYSISIRRRTYGNTTTRKEAIALEEGVILQHVDGSGLPSSGDHGSFRSRQRRAGDSRAAGRGFGRAPAKGFGHHRDLLLRNQRVGTKLLL